MCSEITTGLPSPRITIRSKETIADDLAFFGRKVGPRRPRPGLDKRTHRQIEDFCLRRLLLAAVEAGEITLPVSVVVPMEGQKFPDFVLVWNEDRKLLGVEITAAGEATWNKWLSETDASDEFVLLPRDGYTTQGIRSILYQDIRQALLSKTERLHERAYDSVAETDLVIYENSEGGFLSEDDDRKAVIESLRKEANAIRASDPWFRRVHLIFGDTVHLDLFGKCQPIDVTDLHGDDWTKWLSRQAERLRTRSFNKLDAENLASELESLVEEDRSRLSFSVRGLLEGLLRWKFLPEQRDADLIELISACRDDIEEVFSESPSLENELKDFVANQYKKARARLLNRTKLEPSTLPHTLPFELDELRNRDFLPDA